VGRETGQTSAKVGTVTCMPFSPVKADCHVSLSIVDSMTTSGLPVIAVRRFSGLHERISGCSSDQHPIILESISHYKFGSWSCPKPHSTLEHYDEAPSLQCVSPICLKLNVDSPLTQIVLVSFVCFGTVGMFSASRSSMPPVESADSASIQPWSWWHSKYVQRYIYALY